MAGDIKIRLMEAGDLEAVAKIDQKVLKISRHEYYKAKFDKLFNSNDYVPTSFVAETGDGKVIGFIMGELFIGEYGISGDMATLDTIGVDPDYQKKGIGRLLMKEFLDHLKSLGVRKVNTLVDMNDTRLLHFFTSNGFSPSRTVNLERGI